jgi:hypothetical protein
MQPLIDGGFAEQQKRTFSSKPYVITDSGRGKLEQLRAQYGIDSGSRDVIQLISAPKAKSADPIKDAGEYPGMPFKGVSDADFRRELGPYAKKIFDRMRDPNKKPPKSL